MHTALLSLALALPQEAPKEVLFLGNSYTNVNNLPVLVEGFAGGAGHVLTTAKNTPGGYTLGTSPNRHSTNPTSLNLIASKDWDFVVLQEQSYTPTIPFNKTNYMIPGATVLDAAIKANDPSTQTLLYQTWGRRFGGQYCWGPNCSPVFADFGAMQDSLTAAYDEVAVAIGAEVAPVGEAWRLALAGDPSLVLHTPDDSHPRLQGSYLAAAVFFGTIYGESPVGNSFTAGLPAGLVDYLQDKAAHTIWDPTSGSETFTAGPGTTNTLALSATGSAGLGDTLSFSITNLPTAAPGSWLAFSLAELSAPLSNGTLLIDPAQLASGVTFVAAGASAPITLPLDPAFTGLNAFGQAFAADGPELALSNGFRIEICP
jgi:hypothetical protein